MNILRRVLRVLRWLLLGVWLVSINSQRIDTEQAATVTVVSGAVTATGSNGVTRLLNEGDAVYAGDLIVTGADSVIDLSYEDGGEMTLRPLSRVSIDAFHYEASAHVDSTDQPGQADQAGSADAAAQSGTFETAAFHLLKGGLRAVSGLVGHIRRDDYEMDTPTATIGIRGTEYDLRYCQDDCGDEADNGASPANGLYTQVGKGAIAVRNDGGESPVAEGQASFATSRKQASYVLQQPPAALRHMALPPRLAERAAVATQHLQQVRSVRTQMRMQQLRSAPPGAAPRFMPRALTPRAPPVGRREEPRAEAPREENKAAEHAGGNEPGAREAGKNEGRESPKAEAREERKGEERKGEERKGEERKGEARESGRAEAGRGEAGRGEAGGREAAKAEGRETPRSGAEPPARGEARTAEGRAGQARAGVGGAAAEGGRTNAEAPARGALRPGAVRPNAAAAAPAGAAPQAAVAAPAAAPGNGRPGLMRPNGQAAAPAATTQPPARKLPDKGRDKRARN